MFCACRCWTLRVTPDTVGPSPSSGTFEARLSNKSRPLPIINAPELELLTALPTGCTVVYWATFPTQLRNFVLGEELRQLGLSSDSSARL